MGSGDKQSTMMETRAGGGGQPWMEDAVNSSLNLELTSANGGAPVNTQYMTSHI